MNHKPRILFFSTGNATRSRMAAGFLCTSINEQAIGATSTAVKATDVSPLTVEVMEEIGIDITKQQAKSVEQSLKEHFACVVTLSDDSKERSPVWPFTKNLVHWNVVDPASTPGTMEQRRNAFRAVRDELQQLVGEFVRSVIPDLSAHGLVKLG